MNRPLIGLTGRRRTGESFVDQPEALRYLEADCYYADYTRGVVAAGGLPVHLPLDVDPTLFVERLDGILISGGGDIAAERYGAEPAATTEPPQGERDDFELGLLAAAHEAALPVLGICRGLQIINVHAGGTLNQHVPEHARYDVNTNERVHEITLAVGSTLSELYGSSHQVNSLHHQAVDTVGTGLAVTATDQDGTVEGLEHGSMPILAVQWHPEMLDTRDGDPVFQWIVDKSHAYAADRS